MTHQELISFLRYPQRIKKENISNLDYLTEHYPYFVPAHVLKSRILRNNDDLEAEEWINKTSLLVLNRKWLYDFIFAEQRTAFFVRDKKTSGNYLEMIEDIENQGKNVKETLSVLADKLKKARINSNLMNEHSGEKQYLPTEKKEDETSELENQIKVLIKEKKFEEALAILKELNLNNPKKSVYFADQIRFLEKVIANLKK